MKKTTDKENSIKTKNDEISKKRWILLIVFIMFSVFLLKGIWDISKAQEKEEEKKEEDKEDYSDDDLEKVINQTLNQKEINNTFSENGTDISKETDIKNTEVSSSSGEVEIKNLNEEALKLAGNNKKNLEQSIRSWLNGYGFADVGSVTFYGECLIDYNVNTVSLTFTVDTEGTPGFDAIYNKKDNSFSIVAW